MMGRTKEAEKMTNHILSEDVQCLECYRLLSAIFSKQEHYAKVLWSRGVLVQRAHIQSSGSILPSISPEVSCVLAHTQEIFFSPQKPSVYLSNGTKAKHCSFQRL